jgi:hypothetical protein
MTRDEALKAFGDTSNMVVRHRRSGKRYLLNRDIVDEHRDSDGPRVYVYGFSTDATPYGVSKTRAIWFYLDSVDPVTE